MSVCVQGATGRLMFAVIAIAPNVKSTPTLSVAAPVIWAFRAANRSLGVDSDSIWRRAGMPPNALDDPSFRVPWQPALEMLRFSVEASGRDDLGLLAAEHADPGVWELMEFASRSQATLGHALESISRLMPLVADSVELRRDGDGVSWMLSTAPMFRSSAAVDFALAAVVLAARRYTGRPFLAPKEVWVEHPAPRDTAEHGRLFQCIVKFGKWQNRLVFDECDLALPLRRSDPCLVDLLHHVADRALGDKQRHLTTAERVRRLLPGLILNGTASIASVARELGVAPRTLHRRLADERVPFRKLVSEVRQQLALSYLEERRHDIAEIARLLGFSGVPAFHRAFKRWTRETPEKYAAAESA